MTKIFRHTKEHQDSPTIRISSIALEALRVNWQLKQGTRYHDITNDIRYVALTVHILLELSEEEKVELHYRSHQIDSEIDHPTVQEIDRDKLVGTNPITGKIELITKDSVGHSRSHAMTSLLDHAVATGLDLGKFVRANPSTGAWELTDIATTFLELTDVIATTYATKAKYVPMVTDTADSLDLVPSEELVTTLATFILLADVPSNYVGMGGKTVKVKMDESGLEFV